MLPAENDITDTMKVVLRIYFKNSNATVRGISKTVLRPKKSMIALWASEFERMGFVTRIGKGRNMRVFVTEKGKQAML